MYHGAESAEYWVTVGAQHLQHTTSSIMWALKVPNLRHRHKQNRCNICSNSLPQEIYATSPTLFCVSWIVTPRALCGRGAIDVKPLQGFFGVLQAINIHGITRVGVAANF